jgi:hypothetical protein
MYQNRNTYQARGTYPNHRRYKKEARIRQEYVFGTNVGISDQRGGLAIKGGYELKGKNLELVKKVNGRVVFTASASFVPNDGYVTHTVAKFDSLLPGLYETGYFPGHSGIKVSIAPGNVAKMDWS